jgi:hypothetical protein
VIDPQRASRLFAGAAHPVLLTSDAAWKLTQLKGKNWSTFLGAVRVYRPGVTWSGTARAHPLWLIDRHPEPEAVLDAARQVCVDEARWRGLEQWAVPQIRLDRVRSRIDPSMDPGDDSDGWLGLLEEVESERDELRNEVESLRREVDRVILESKGEPVVLPPASVSEAVAQIAGRGTPGLVLLDSAWESAATASFRRPERAMEVLEAVAELAEHYHRGSLEQDFRSFLAQRRVKLGYVSASVRNRWPNDYQRRYDGRTVELSDHAKVGAGTPGETFRVYWYRDEQERKLVVGHVGNHLTNRMT